jgi:hypothetical protein
MDKLIRVLEKALGETPSKPEAGEEKHDEEEVRALMRQAAAAAAAQDWTKAAQTLQAVLSIDPANADAAGQLRSALQQKKLADLFGQGQAAFQRKDYRGALDCFRQVRVMGGNYNDVDNLITLCQESLRDSSGLVVPPKPKRWRWILAGAGGFIVLMGIVVAVQQQNEANRNPAPIVNGNGNGGTTSGGNPPGGTSSGGNNQGTNHAPNNGTPTGKTGGDFKAADYNKWQQYVDGVDNPSPAPATFNPVGTWTLANETTGAGATLFLAGDGSFTVTLPTGPLSAGRWVYMPGNRTVTLSGVNNVGVYFTEIMTIGNPQGRGFEGYDNLLGPILLTRQ